MTLRPTRPAARAADYLRPGGPWAGVPSLDVVATDLAVVDGATGERLDPAALDQRVATVAAGLVAEGVEPGDVVSWRLPNCADAVVLYRACWRIGAVAAPVHHRAGPAEVEAARTQVDPVLTLDDETAVAALAGRGAGSPVAAGTVPVDPAAIAVVQFTSGSTGRPKAVLHTHLTLGYKARLMVGVHRLGAADVVLMPAPMAHISGLLNGILVPGAAGMTVVTMAAWEPSRALDLIEQERVSFMVGPPTFFVALADDPGFEPRRVASLRLLSCGGAGVTPAFVESTAARFACTVKRTYGSTEAPTVATSHPGDATDRARDTDGRATGEAELVVVEGELWVRGPELCQGYALADDVVDRFTDDGWLRTGDLATLDDGWLTITGRLGDVVIRGGENIAAGEVEAVLERHPAVSQAVAVGYPDQLLGERVCAFVVATPGRGVADGAVGLDEVRRWFEAEGVTRFKWPERVELLDELPLLASGKPDRARLRAMAAAPVPGDGGGTYGRMAR